MYRFFGEGMVYLRYCFCRVIDMVVVCSRIIICIIQLNSRLLSKWTFLMSHTFKDKLDGNAWEKYCEKVLRHEFTFRNFVPIPHQDRGDHGLEFYTYCGIIFQCYRPDPSYSMDEYKKHVKAKITKDLKKLKTYEKEISELLGNTTISRWVLMIPEIKSRELIKHCIKKEKDIVKGQISFIDKVSFKVQIETDESFPASAVYARSYVNEVIDLQPDTVNQITPEQWKQSNSTFYTNLCRKTEKINTPVEKLRKELIEKYLSVEILLDAYRDEFPDLHTEVTSKAAANLEELRSENLFIKASPEDVMNKLLIKNREMIDQIDRKISGSNKELISSGFIAQWLAECKMDFVVDE